MSTQSAKAKIGSLTGIRAIAALWVFFHHFAPQPYYQAFTFNHLPFFPVLFSKGYLGVDIFFTLSGMIMCYVHMQDFNKVTLSGYFQFLKLRISRLLPVHYVVLFLYFLFYGAGFLLLGLQATHADKFNLPDLFLNLTLTQAWTSKNVISWNPVSWSISAEWFAYLLFPFLTSILFRVDRKKIGLALVITYIIFAALTLSLWGDSLGVLNNQSLIRVGFEFLIGCLLFQILRSNANRVPAWLTLISVVGFVGGLPFLKDQALYLFVVGLLSGLYASKDVISKFLATKPMVYLGEISYSFYLLHFLMVSGFSKLPSVLSRFMSPEQACDSVFVVAFFMTLLGSHCLFTYVEKPVMKFLRYGLPSLLQKKSLPETSTSTSAG